MTPERHIAEAHRAERAMNRLLGDSDPHNHWVVITAYYEALHWVSALLRAHGIEPRRKHDEILAQIGATPSLRELQTPQRQLLNLSYAARYIVNHAGATVDTVPIMGTVIGNWLYKIRQRAAKDLTEKGHLSLTRKGTES